MTAEYIDSRRIFFVAPFVVVADDAESAIEMAKADYIDSSGDRLLEGWEVPEVIECPAGHTISVDREDGSKVSLVCAAWAMISDRGVFASTEY